MDEDDIVTLNVGGGYFETTMKTIRRVPDTFWSVYFGGNFAQHILADGSHFIDRNAEHFPHVLTFMRNSVLTVGQIGARPSTMLLRAVKREFEFYGIEVLVDVKEKQEIAFFVGGNFGVTTNVEEFMMPENPSSHMFISCDGFGAALIDDDIYVTGGYHEQELSSSMEIFSCETGLWSAGPSMPVATHQHVLVAVGQDLYNIGGSELDEMVVMKFNGRTQTWHLLHTEPLTDSISNCATAVVGTTIYFFDTVDNVYTFDTVTEVWHKLPAMPPKSFTRGSSAIVCNGLIYIVGPYGLTCFDPRSEVSIILAPPLSKREFGSTFVLDGVLHVAGGYKKASSVERYNVLNNTWEFVADMKEERSWFQAITWCQEHVVQKDIFEVLIERSLRKETLAELRATLNNDTELAKMRAKISADMHVEVCAQWRSDVIAQMNADDAVLDDIRNEIRAKIRAEIYEKVCEDLRTEIRSDFDVDSSLLNEIRAEELTAIRARMRQDIESSSSGRTHRRR
jgi:hypothetical protein